METLRCDIDNISKYLKGTIDTAIDPVNTIKDKLLFKSKTKPARYALRCSCFIGVCCDLFAEEPRMFDIVVKAIKEANKELED